MRFVNIFPLFRHYNIFSREGFTLEDTGNQILGKVNGILIGPGDIQLLSLPGIGFRIAALTVHCKALDIPGGHILHLHFYQIADFLGGKAGFKHTLQTFQNIRVIGNQSLAGAKLIDHSLNDLHLVLAAAIVATLDIFPLSGKGHR